jgi:6-methylsalicylate decarboxylase
MVISRRELLVGAASGAAGISLTASNRATAVAKASQALAPAKLRLIDTHHHIFPPFYVNAIGLDAASSHTGNLPTWSVEGSLQAMDRSDIELAVVSISNPGVALQDSNQAPRLARQCNDFAHQMIADHPGRFDAFAVLPMPNVRESLAEIKYGLEELKFAGIGLLTNYNGIYLGDPRFDSLFNELHRREAVVFVHPAESTSAPLHSSVPSPIIEFPHDTTWAIASLLYNGVFSRYGGIRFIFSHAGGTVLSIGTRFQIKRAPEGADPMLLLKRQYYDLALSTNPITMPALLAFVGPGHVVFGSDYPFASQQSLTAGVDYLATVGRENQDVSMIERETALALFRQVER